MTGQTKHPPPWFADGRRRKDHGARSRVAEWRAYQAAWQKPIDSMADATPETFYNLRRNILHLNRAQCARLLRCSVQSVVNWESGLHPVPFYGYLALLLVSESQHYRLANEAWREWEFIQRMPDDAFQQRKGRRDNVITELVNAKLGAAFTPRQLEWIALEIQRVAALKSEVVQLQGKVDELTRENSEIRELFRVDGMTGELQQMRQRMDGLLARINTAAVLSLKKAAA